MKKLLCTLLVLALSLPLAACAAGGTPTSQPLSALNGAENLADDLPPSAPPDGEPSTEKPAAQPSTVQYADLGFLNGEQQAAYQLALELYPYITYNTEAWPMAEADDARPQLDAEQYPGYYPGGGGMELWEDFLLHWTNAFTPRYLTAMLEQRPCFMEYEGYTWFLPGAASGPWPHTIEYYEISLERDDLVDFYARRVTANDEGEAYVNYDEVRLIKTDDGEWRCDYLSLLGAY